MNAKHAYHPNTRLLYSAWRRMSEGAEPDNHAAAQITSHPDLVSRLFILRLQDGQWMFRNAGSYIGKLFGRDLTDHQFISIWTGPDKSLIGALAESVDLKQEPGFIRANGETLTGETVALEIMLAPMTVHVADDQKRRLLGIYQTLDDESELLGRPIWRHRISSLVTPENKESPPHIRLVANNDT